MVALLIPFREDPDLRAPIQTSERKDSLAIFSEDEQNREAPQELMEERAIPVTTGYGDAPREKVLVRLLRENIRMLTQVEESLELSLSRDLLAFPYYPKKLLAKVTLPAAFRSLPSGGSCGILGKPRTQPLHRRQSSPSVGNPCERYSKYPTAWNQY